MLVIFSVGNKSINTILILAVNRLNGKQRKILRQVASEQNINATVLVGKISRELNCSVSCVWSNLNYLRTVGLIHSGSLKSKRIKVQLTGSGEIMAKILGDKYGWN